MTETSPADRVAAELRPATDALLLALGESFDMRAVTAAGELGEAVRQRLLGIDIESPPIWGTPGSMTQVAHQGTAALDFYYRPHLFPEMSPELRLAHYLQFDLLPRELPADCPLQIAAVLESYCHLSGDLLGWRQTDGGFLLWIADIAGHGVRAGLAAAVFHFLMDSLDAELSLAELAAALNHRMVATRNPDDRRALYATAFLMRVESDGTLRYASAGHPPMMHRDPAGAVTQLRAQAPPIGLIPGQEYEESPLPLGTEDILFLYTDGLLEACSPTDEEFGTERIERLVRSSIGTPLDLSQAAYRSVRAHKDTQLLDDDLTFLAARLA